MSTCKPARALYSKKIECSLRVNILPLIHKKCSVMACRVQWTELNKNGNLSLQERRCSLDKALTKLDGIEFFFSCIGGTSTNSTKGNNSVRPGISYFIVFIDTGTTDESSIYRCLYQSGLMPSISFIKAKKAKGSNSESSDNIMNSLKQALKDHNSSYAKSLITANNVHPLSIHCVNDKMRAPISASLSNIQKDGLQLNISENIPAVSTNIVRAKPQTGFGKAIETTRKFMSKLKHVLHRGKIYAKLAEAQVSFKYLCDAESYVQKLLACASVQDDIINYKEQLKTLLQSHSCEAIQQINFDTDIFEVNNGKYFKLSSRAFIDCPFSKSDLGVVAPRKFFPYDASDDLVDGGYFEASVFNSFPDLEEQIKFLNKFYQCLLYGQLPHKATKLVTVGPSNSGKTSWVRVLFGLLGEENVVSITKEKSFGMSMLSESSQLIFIDEWSSDTMSADQAKSLLQGGWLVQAVKHKNARTVVNKAGIYITCNEIPTFGSEQVNVEKRLSIFKTEAITNAHPDAPQWMEVNAFQCLMWLVQQLNKNSHLIPKNERFYKKNDDVFVPRSNNVFEESELCKMQSVNAAELEEIQVYRYSDDESAKSENSPSTSSARDKRNSVRRSVGRFEEEPDEDCLNISASEVEESDIEPSLDRTKRAFRKVDINSYSYNREVRRLLLNDMDKDEIKGHHYLSFSNQFKDGIVKNSARPFPAIDAWLCITGNERDIFDAEKFIRTYPSIKSKICELRKKCGFSVLPSSIKRCSKSNKERKDVLQENVVSSSDDEIVIRNDGKRKRKSNTIESDEDSSNNYSMCEPINRNRNLTSTKSLENLFCDFQVNNSEEHGWSLEQSRKRSQSCQQIQKSTTASLENLLFDCHVGSSEDVRTELSRKREIGENYELLEECCNKRKKIGSAIFQEKVIRRIVKLSLPEEDKENDEKEMHAIDNSS